MDMKRGTFKVSLSDHARTVAPHDTGWRHGLVNALFGIHGTTREGFTVTHLASGKKCAEGASLDHCKRIAGELSELPIDWQIAEPLSGCSPKVREWIIGIASGKVLQP